MADLAGGNFEQCSFDFFIRQAALLRPVPDSASVAFWSVRKLLGDSAEFRAASQRVNCLFHTSKRCLATAVGCDIDPDLLPFDGGFNRVLSFVLLVPVHQFLTAQPSRVLRLSADVEHREFSRGKGVVQALQRCSLFRKDSLQFDLRFDVVTLLQFVDFPFEQAVDLCGQQLVLLFLNVIAKRRNQQRFLEVLRQFLLNEFGS